MLFTLSNFTRARLASVTSFFVEFCAFQSSLAARYLNDPPKRLVPDFEITSTIAPVERPNSADTADVRMTTSWMASKFRLAPKVPVTGSVVLTPSIRNWLLLVSAPWAFTLPVPTTPGAAPTRV